MIMLFSPGASLGPRTLTSIGSWFRRTGVARGFQAPSGPLPHSSTRFLGSLVLNPGAICSPRLQHLGFLGKPGNYLPWVHQGPRHYVILFREETYSVHCLSRLSRILSPSSGSTLSEGQESIFHFLLHLSSFLPCWDKAGPGPFVSQPLTPVVPTYALRKVLLGFLS